MPRHATSSCRCVGCAELPEVFGGWRSGTCYYLDHPSGLESLYGPFCRKHFLLWYEVERDLPLVIQEVCVLGSLAAFYGVHASSETLVELIRARKRLKELRELEARLKGIGDAAH
jgi:hypothetical protein